MQKNEPSQGYPRKSSLLRRLLNRSINMSVRCIGLDPRKIMTLRNVPRFLSDCRKFKKAGGSISQYSPILDEFTDQAGTARGHYFHQDLLVASYIFKANPVRHIDIGSRIDGFVAHVASFREIEVMDVRDLQESEHENIKFTRADLMIDDMSCHEVADSISCLHALEHFGLGRYGDPIDPQGYILGFRNIVKMLRNGGTLYISFPIGVNTRVHFNAHRVFHPREIFTWDQHDRVELIRFSFVDDDGKLQRDFPLMERLPSVNFGCGIYTLRKHN